MSYIEIVEENESFDLPCGESVFHLRRLEPEVLTKIEKAHTKRERNTRTGTWMFTTEQGEVNKAILDYVITGWGGVRSPTTGKDVECTPENKWRLPGKIKVEILDACDVGQISEEKKTRPKTSGTP